MSPPRRRWFPILLLMVWVGSAAAATDEPDFGVLDDEPYLAAWLDLAPHITQSQVEKIRDKIDPALDFSLTLTCPGKFFRAWTTAEKQGFIR